MASELGAYLDPLADKVLIVSIYVALGHRRRDAALAGHPGRVARHDDRRRRCMLSWLIGKPVSGEAASWSPSSIPRRRSCWSGWCWPRSVSASMRLGADAASMVAVAVLTCSRSRFYLREWVRHMDATARDDQ